MQKTLSAHDKTPGWGLALLDTVIVWLLPSVGGYILHIMVAEGTVLMAALLSLQILAFYMIGKVRGRVGLIRHLTRVVGLMGAVSLLMNKATSTEWLTSLLILIGCAALGGWVGARRE